MPNRIIKESICTSDSIDGLSWFEEVLFYRLIVNCDDYGRYDGRPTIIKNRLFPLKDKALTLTAVSTALNSLEHAGLIVTYETDGKPYLYLPTWNKHQTIRAKKSKYPAPDSHMKLSEYICNQMISDVPVIQSNPNTIQSEYEKEGADKPQRFSPPTIEEVTEYCQERNNKVDPQSFIDFYSSKGWMIGKNRMKDWKAAVRTWEKRDQNSHSRITTAADYIAPAVPDLNRINELVEMI